jgi:transposase
LGRSSTNPQRDVLDRPHRSSLERYPGTIRSLADHLRPVQPMAEERDPGSNAGAPADPVGQGRQTRLGSVVHRREFDSSQPRCGGGRKKGGPEEPADHALGRSRGGFGTKLHLVCDSRGNPIAFDITAGQKHESTAFQEVLNAVRIPQPSGPPRRRPQRLAGDKGYAYRRVRAWLRSRKIRAVIPHAPHQEGKTVPSGFDPKTYRRRNIIERCVGWMKEWRRIGTRFEKLAVNFLGMLKLVVISRYLKIQLSDGT